IVEPSFLAETCTPSSSWPEAEVIEPVSNWSAEAVLAAPINTKLATLTNNWRRICVMVFSSFACNAAMLFADLSIRVRRRGRQGKGLHGETPILLACGNRPLCALFGGTGRRYDRRLAAITCSLPFP